MQFKDIEGQEVFANRLTEIIDSGRVSHAQLFLGATAGGSLALALAYAQYLNCEHRRHFDDGPLRADSCGQCPSCLKYGQLMHPDLHLVFPTFTTTRVTSKPCAEEFEEEFRAFLADCGQRGTETQWYAALGAENKQGMIRERDADNIVSALSLKPFEAAYKTLVVWMAERMNPAAANTLLKTIEEPLGQTLIVLVSESSERMLPTILSRTQQVVVPLPQERLAQPQAEQFAGLFVSWMRLLFKLNMQPLSGWVDGIAALGRETQKQFLLYAEEAVRACLLKTAAGLALGDRLQFGDEKFNASFPAMITPNNAEQICRAMNETLYAIERNAYAKISFMQLSFKMSKYLKNR